jgi:hypothetical protein
MPTYEVGHQNANIWGLASMIFASLQNNRVSFASMNMKPCDSME